MEVLEILHNLLLRLMRSEYLEYSTMPIPLMPPQDISVSRPCESPKPRLPYTP